jgi:hypothetical protein
MAAKSIAEILDIKSEQDFKNAVNEYEHAMEITFKPLQDKLAQQVLTTEVQQLELHMTYVESWRDRAAKALMLATAFENHGKSRWFLLAGGKGITATDREAYQKDLTSSAGAQVVYFEELLRSIDSRVNICKKVLGNESQGAINTRRFS